MERTARCSRVNKMPTNLIKRIRSEFRISYTLSEVAAILDRSLPSSQRLPGDPTLSLEIGNGVIVLVQSNIENTTL